MSWGRVFEWYQPLDMRELCVPIKDCVTVKPGPLDPNVIVLLESHHPSLTSVNGGG